MRAYTASLMVTVASGRPGGLSQQRWSLVRQLLLAVACIFGLLLPSVVTALDPTRSIAQFHHSKWDISNGMPANIWAITQTRDGYLWLGSVDGLYRFDGLRVERIAADRLPSPSVHALAATKSGGVWIGYERPVGVISLLQNGVLKNFPVDAPFSTSVHNIVIGPDNVVWASTSEAILRFDGKRWQAMKSNWGTSFGEEPGGVWAFGVARDGTVWSKNLNGLFYLKPGSSRFVQVRGYSGGAEGFATTPDGRLWTTDSTAGFLYALPDLKGVNDGVVPAPARSISVPQALRGPILLDSDGTFWCVSFSDGGLCRASNKTMHANGRFTAKDGLSSDLVRSLFEDREGNIWVGTSLGLDRFRAANVVTEKRVPVGFRARFVEATPGALYAYTGWSSTASRESDGTESLYRILPGRAPEMFVRNIGRLRGMDVNVRTGAMWVTTQKGVQEVRNGGLGPPVELPTGVDGSMVFSAAHDTGGALWLSAFGRGVFRQQSGIWNAIPVRSKKGATAVLIADPDGSMWVRYSGGALFRVAGDKVQDFSGNRLNIGDVTFISSQGRGLCIGGESGIGRIENGKFYALNAANVPALTGVTGITDTRDGSSWIFTQAGILRVTTKVLESALRNSDPKALKFELYDSRDGLPGAPYGAVYGSTAATDLAGRAWFTTGNGLVWIDPNNLHHNSLPPNVIVRSATVGDRRYDSPVDLHLPAGTSKLQIDYAGLSLTMPERNRYKYKLDGVDDGWVDPGSRRQAFYTNLRPGNYKFHVIASNNDGVWNRTGATLAITIPPTFVQSLWFKLLLVLVVAGLIWLLYQMRVRQVTAQLQSRMEERLAERERIARELHDTLLQGVQGLLLRFQSVADLLPANRPERNMLEGALDRAEAVLVEGRDRVRELRTDDSGGDLSQSFAALIEELSKDSGANPNLAIEGVPRPLHPLVFDEASRIGGEAIRNAFHHAHAKTVDVALVYQRREFTLAVNDDGIGFDDKAASARGSKGHYGLVGMRERAQRIGGELTISSRRGGGTQVTLKVPGRTAYARERELKKARLAALADS